MEPGFPRISHISANAAHQGGLVFWYGLGRPVTTSLVPFRIVWMVFCVGDNHEMGRARTRTVRCHHDPNKAASVLRLRLEKVSSSNTSLIDLQVDTLCLYRVISQPSRPRYSRMATFFCILHDMTQQVLYLHLIPYVS